MTEKSDHSLYTLGLARVPGLGPKRWRQLHKAFGETPAIFHANKRALLALSMPEGVANGILNPDWDGAGADLAWLRAKDSHHLITIDDPNYPEKLREIASPPPVLFLDGPPESLHLPQIAIVGSRHANAAGIELASEFAKALVHRGYAITSGLATGIDAAAHRAAIEANGATLAVIATGPDLTYPRRHHRLRDQIAAQGAVLGENPTGVTPRANLFPRRNRIVSGLSQGVVVIQAGRHSGALITARMAADQGREVFAVPGSIHDPLARGCHALLRQGAKLVESVYDIIEELPYWEGGGDEQPELNLNWDNSPEADVTINKSFAADKEQALLMAALGHDPVTLDTLMCRSGLTLDRVSSILLNMEIKGLVAALPGGRYQRRGPEVKK
ncbi:rossmann fold nucleotide-binding protein Smf [Halorhodospira halochloris]|uniref:Rossmann fold nucleotide-binding protein Smf n=1 Tax=Halorhodospira halochloris TaxID=1052 RepID=A0A0X8X741_HALHR|nr:DNA-processing protein DprA [Halorhodospira halochloris]MBK1650701.1 DNA-protecting protein DprA [Halorhodospira halochloris]BAU56810.1 rossmann fold nucleotide-binding protein Smf [Halorhodospira halochloris]